jgi:uncharacterized protein (TIGR02145 family)
VSHFKFFIMENIYRFDSYVLQLLVTSLIFTCSFFYTSAQKAGTTVTDIEGNKYKTVVIGNQEWMAENLKTTKYNDGTDIPLEKENKNWITINTPAYCWYDNDIANKDIYGALYNWQAVNTGKLCPKGWRVPTDEEWAQLTDFLGGLNAAGVKLKEAGNVLWNSPNAGANNESGFTARPGGYRYGYFWGNGEFYEKGLNGYFWTATEYTETHSRTLTVNAERPKVYRSAFVKNNGFSLRCIKDK